MKTSQNILKQKVEFWGEKNGIHHITVVESFDLPDDNDLRKLTDIVLFGDFLATYLYLVEKHIENKNLYVLCSKAKMVLESLGASKTFNVHVIDRYDLFSLNKTLRKLPNLKKDKFNLIYSGRITRSKNIKQLIRLFHLWQKENPNIGLKIVGEFDNHHGVGLETTPYLHSVEKELKDYIKKMSWTSEPQIIHGLGPDQWLNEVDANDVLINLSTYWMDDFSVSIAQAQEKGIPVIITDIGGMSDVVGANALKIPAHLVRVVGIPQTDEVALAQSRSVLNHILSSKPNLEKTEIKPAEFHKIPRFDEVVEDHIFDYVRTPQGVEFFRGYESIWLASGQEKPRTMLYLASSEQNHWTSLIQITEQVKKYWIQFQTSSLELKVINVDGVLDKNMLMKMLSSLEIVIAPALATNTINVLDLIRNKLKSNARVAAYPHELSSIFFGSLKMRKLHDFFRKSDIFVVFCDADIKTTQKSFRGCNVVKVPAGFIEEDEPRRSVLDYQVQSLYYIGRVSEQKNLHTLFWALSLIRDELVSKKITLNIYGHHDHFGSPNCGLSGGAYYDYLGNLAVELGIDSIVKFHGFVSVKNWGELVTKNNGAGVFPSLHSDENFGYAPFDLLKAGVPVLTSSWGGFQDLQKAFPHNSIRLPVDLSKCGPVINPIKLANSLKKLLRFKSNSSLIDYEKWFRHNWNDHISEWINERNVTVEPLKLSSLSVELNEKCEYSPLASLRGRGWMLNGKLFDGYADEKFNQSSKLYGAKDLKIEKEGRLIIAPWVKKEDRVYKVNDPMRGELVVKSSQKLQEIGAGFKLVSRVKS